MGGRRHHGCEETGCSTPVRLFSAIPGAVDLGRVYLDVDDRRPVECVQPPHLQDSVFCPDEVDHTERDRVRAVGRADGKYPFLGRCPGRDCPENCPVRPFEPAQDPEVLLPFDLPEGGAVFFINHYLGDGIGQAPLPRCIALCLVGGVDVTNGVEFDGCRSHA